MVKNALPKVGFYTKDFNNYTGKTKKGTEFYTEVIAEYILEHKDDIVPYTEVREEFKMRKRKSKAEPGTERALCRADGMMITLLGKICLKSHQII